MHLVLNGPAHTSPFAQRRHRNQLRFALGRVCLGHTFTAKFGLEAQGFYKVLSLGRAVLLKRSSRWRTADQLSLNVAKIKVSA
jgi:hypothetical protein